jgi:hypothetical protein
MLAVILLKCFSCGSLDADRHFFSSRLCSLTGSAFYWVCRSRRPPHSTSLSAKPVSPTPEPWTILPNVSRNLRSLKELTTTPHISELNQPLRSAMLGLNLPTHSCIPTTIAVLQFFLPLSRTSIPLICLRTTMRNPSAFFTNGLSIHVASFMRRVGDLRWCQRRVLECHGSFISLHLIPSSMERRLFKRLRSSRRRGPRVFSCLVEWGTRFIRRHPVFNQVPTRQSTILLILHTTMWVGHSSVFTARDVDLRTF